MNFRIVEISYGGITRMDWLTIGMGVLLFTLGRVTPPIRETAMWKRFISKRNNRRIRELESGIQEEGDWSFMDLRFPKIAPLSVHVFRETALTPRQISSKPVRERRDLASDVEDVKEMNATKFEKRCRQRGQTYHDDPTYSLDGIYLTRSVETERRVNHLEFRFSRSSYSDFAGLNLSLDEPWPSSSKDERTLRQVLDLDPDDVDTRDLSPLPLHTKVGTATLLVTADNQLVLMVRSSSQAVATGGEEKPMVHVLGEGMIAGKDARRTGAGEVPDPFRTVNRALRDELRLSIGHDYDPGAIRLLAVCFDFQRYQPLMIFTLQLNCDADELDERWRLAKDFHEHGDVVYAPNDPQVIVDILQERYQIDGASVAPASNHAALALFLPMLFYHGFGTVKRAARSAVGE